MDKSQMLKVKRSKSEMLKVKTIGSQKRKRSKCKKQKKVKRQKDKGRKVKKYVWLLGGGGGDAKVSPDRRVVSACFSDLVLLYRS